MGAQASMFFSACQSFFQLICAMVLQSVVLAKQGSGHGILTPKNGVAWPWKPGDRLATAR